MHKLKATVCGVSSALMLVGGIAFAHAMILLAERIHGGKLNSMGRWIDVFLPQPRGDGPIFAGAAVFAVGYGLLAVGENISRMICALHVLLGGVLLVVGLAAVQTIVIGQGVSPPSPPEPIAPWFIVCSMPLTFVAIQRLRTRIGASRSPLPQ